MLSRTILVVLLVTLAALIAPLAAQEKPAAAPEQPPAKPADVSSPDAILTSLYHVISGPAGQPRDWNRFRSLFAPGARLIPTGQRPDGTTGARVLTPEDYIARATPIFEKDGFYEKGIARRTERFGNILHAFSTYEARHKADDAQPFLRGINSIQLYFDGSRWWILTVFWQPETPESSLPKDYLPK